LRRAARASARRRVLQHGPHAHFTELDRLSRDFGSWLQNVRGLPAGARVAIMMPNLLQYPVALFGALRAGFTVVNCNPLYTPRELEHQLKDSGAEAIVILENFAKTLEAVIAQTQVRTVVTTQIGDMLGFPKSAHRQLVVKRVKKMVPAWSLPGTIAFADALAAGARQPLEEPPLARATSRSCSTPAAPPASPRARCSPTATSSRTCCRPRAGGARACARARK
jgi:long-chain acyl-CoA synthetase